MGINEKEFYKRSVWDKITDYKKSVIAIIVGIVLATLLYISMTQKVYTTDAIVEVSPKMNQLGTLAQSQNGENVFFRHLQTQIDFLQSRSLIEKVVERLHANILYYRKEHIKYLRVAKNLPFRITYIKVKDPAFYEHMFVIKALDDKKFALSLMTKKGLFGWEQSKPIVYPFAKLLETKYFDIAIEREKPLERTKTDTLYFRIFDKKRYIEQVLRNLSVLQNSEKSSMVKILYSDTNAYSAKRFVNTLIETYLDINTNSEIEEAQELLQIINTKLKEEKAKLEDVEKLLKNYIAQNKVAGLDEQTSKIIQTIYQYELQLEGLKLKLHKLDTISRIFRQTGNYKSIISLVSEISNPGLSKYIESITADEAQYLQLRLKYSPKYPDVQKIQRTIETKMRSLEKSILDLQKDTRYQIQKIRQYLQKYKSDLSSVPQKEFGYTQLKRQYDLLEKHYLFLLEKKTQIIVSDRVQGAYDYKVIDYAYEAPFPSRPKKKILFLLALVLGSLLAILYALVRDYFSRYIHTPSEIEELSDLPYLGTIPYIEDKKLYNDLFVLKAPEHLASEMIWSLRTTVEDFIPAKEERGKIIAVTSIVKGEGKTTIAANLALSFGMGDKKTVVIAMDTRLPELHLKFGVPNDPGITSVICGDKKLDEVIFKSRQWPNFAIIPAGEVCKNPLEMINSGKVDFLLKTLKTRYDYVVLDLPPVGVAAETIFFMRKADFVLSVLKANYSEKSFVTYMENIVRKHKIAHVGFVLNSVDKKYIKILTRRENVKYLKTHAYVSGQKKRKKMFDFLKYFIGK